MELLLSRLPIFDRQERVIAYEVLHSAVSTVAAEPGSDEAVRLLVDALLGVGLRDVADGQPALVRVSPWLLGDSTLLQLPSSQMILGLDAQGPFEAGTMETCAALSDQGYRVALLGLRPDAPGMALLPVVGAARVDVPSLDADALAFVASQAVRHEVHLIAEHVKDRTMRDRCTALGFSAFQGYRFAQAQTVARRDMRASHGALIDLLNKLRNHGVHDRELEEAFQRDLPLSYKLLRIVNSAAMGRREVWSIGHAIRLLGRDALYQWLSLLLLGGGGAGGVQGELSRASLARGRFCELIGGAAGVPRAGPSLFITGFFSLLDIVLGVPMPELVAQLDLASDVRAALLHREEFYGAVLSLAEAYEEGDWATVLVQGANVGVDAAQIPVLFREALAWAKAQRTSELAAA
ncbi:MAG: HDOD domain-containing protein [Gemmatimonadota bacterium]|nr:HDOD domain-containing protein [Gemmatimonadota bacterium]